MNSHANNLRSIKRVLVLTTDLPYFPGKNGHDHFNLRHLARQHQVSVVSPTYDWFPQEGVANLRRFLHRAHLWPAEAEPIASFVPGEPDARLPAWMLRVGRRWRWRVLRRLLRIHRRPDDAFDKLAILANCAPHLLEAITSSHPHVTVLIQTNLEPWLDYLPAVGSKLVYFHDVRSDYLSKVVALPGLQAKSAKEIALIRRQEQQVVDRADVVAFVSELDSQRAQAMFSLRAQCGVAPIPVDTEYYSPAPTDWQRDARPIVLFTGHLSHPPNVDAVLYFLTEIWPSVLARFPSALFQVVGMAPAEELKRAIEQAGRCELHANVADIRPYFWDASVYVVPMRFGGGVRQKLFEAWSMRLPVVCTSMAAEGTGAEHGKQCWLENVPSEFAEKIASLLQTDAAEELLSAAKEHVESRNSIAAAAPLFQAQVEKAASIQARRPYKLLYDLRWMEIGAAGGMEQATYELIDTIGQLDRRNGYRLFAPRSTCSEWDFPSSFDVKMHYSDAASRQKEVLQSFLANRLAESLGMPALLNPAMRSLASFNRMDFDLVHSVCGYTHPDLISLPGILTINDLQHLHYPEFFTPDEWKEREKLYRESAKKAQHIICISEYTRQDVHAKYGIPLEKMTTVWIIPSRAVWREIPQRERHNLLAGMGISSEFLFFPAHCWPHKNHINLVRAFQSALSELPKDLKLVLTGRSFPQEHPAAEFIREHGLGDRVVHLGYRSPLEIRALYQSCLALVFPSLFEGYGMPVAEAIIAGRPVVCSNASSLPEIAGNVAVTFDPHDVADISRRLIEIATQPELRLSLARAALNRRHLFSSRRSAIQTMEVYHRVHQELYGD